MDSTMNDYVYFDGDPSTDSTRRHMERVLKTPDAPRRWPWLLAALGTGGVWWLWRLGRDTVRERESSATEPERSPEGPPPTSTRSR
jgi:hypothetical protein